MKPKHITPWPYPLYFLPVVLIAIIGILDSAYLSISHYRVYTDVGYQSFCAISKAINCDTVSQSRYSIFIGMPVPVWGIIGYSFVLLLLTFAGTKSAERKRIWPLLFIIASCFNVYSIYLALISTFIIHSYCIMCIVLYVVNFFLLYFIWIIRNRFEEAGIVEGLKQDINFIINRGKKIIIIFTPFLMGVVLIWFLFPAYWRYSPPLVSSDIHTGMTDDGYPWIGAEKPVLVIVEFVDYQCFQCRKMHFYLRRLIADYPDKIRLVHRQFPMDHQVNPIVKKPFHIGSGTLALLAISMEGTGAFWDMNDVLFNLVLQRQTINIEGLVKKVDVDPEMVMQRINSPLVRQKLFADIKAGLDLGLTGTPSYLINGKVYNSVIPADIIENVLD